MGGEGHRKAERQVINDSDERWDQFRLSEKYLQGVKDKSTESDGQENASANNGVHQESDSSGSSPLLVFINAGSGGRVGEQLSRYFQKALRPSQVFEVGKNCKPEDVLKQVWANFDKEIQSGDESARHVRDSLRLLACGGDGTIAWLLSSVKKLQLDPCPASSVIPLGTGNGLSINFGWGKTMRANWIATNDLMLKEFEGVAKAEVRDIDIWKIDFKTDDSQLLNKEEVPAALSVSNQGENGAGSMGGDFCYYFTFGLDAEGAYRFDHLRKTKPHLTKKRKVNIFWYMYFIIRTGWFCGASPLREKISKLEIKDKNGKWIDVKIARELRAMIIINLQTYSGGRDIWGLKDKRKSEGEDKGFVSPIFDDGLLEIVGLEGGWKSWAALSGIRHNLHGRRIAQANEIKITYHSPKEKKGVAMRLDGEPWWQDLPDRDDQNIVVHIQQSGSARILLNTADLPGVNKKVLAFADREKKHSKPSHGYSS